MAFFGRVIAHLHVLEFEKRGLPHGHIMSILPLMRSMNFSLPDMSLYVTVYERILRFPWSSNYPPSKASEFGMVGDWPVPSNLDIYQRAFSDR
jgi:hypothetical protein